MVGDCVSRKHRLVILEGSRGREVIVEAGPSGGNRGLFLNRQFLGSG